MALNKQALNINFAKGLDTKTDPFQVQPGKFLALQNTVFEKGGLLQKRNGYGALGDLPDNTTKFITTFNGNLTAIGANLQAYSSTTATWVNKGPLKPINLSTLPLIRSNTNQSQFDSVVASNGLMCTVYTDNVPSGLVTVPVYKYVIADSITGQNIVAPTVITPPGGTVEGSPRVFLVGQHFLIVYTNFISGAYHLRYLAISLLTPSVVFVSAHITSQYTPSSTVDWDGVVINNSLYLAWNGNDPGNAIRMTFIDQSLTLHNIVSFPGRKATIMSVAADQSNNVVYASFYDSISQTGYTLAVDNLLATILVPTLTISATSVKNITSSVQNQVCTVIYEVNNSYTYDSSIVTDFIRSRTITQTGVLGTVSVISRSLGLASKSFIINNIIYYLGIYSSAYQPSYFLMDVSGNVISRIAYSNGGILYSLGLPSVTVLNNEAKIAYSFKDLVQAANKTQGNPSPTGVYSQTGINLVTFSFVDITAMSVEIGNDLIISGGFLWQYDGYSPVEQGFFLWPDYVEGSASTTGGAMSAQQYFYVATYEWADNQGNVYRSAPSIPVEIDASNASTTPISFTSSFSSGATSITVSSIAGLKVGQVLTDTTTPANIQAGTQITSINGSVLGLSLPTAGISAGNTLQTVTTLSVTVNVPTLRLTYKIANPVKIVIYRWSTAQQNYYQVTSIQVPVLNNTSVDSIAYTDTLADSSILGNNILYTTGGVLENISAPSTSAMTLFQSRLFMLDAEDPNLVWFSKQVIEATPVEMTDLLTLFVAPTIGGGGSTGNLKSLSSMDDKLILFKQDAIYYINGEGPDNTGANSQFSEPIFITATVGCSNQQSIVFMPNGLMFQSDKGIWLLGRDLSTSYIGAAVEKFTEAATVLSAVNVPGTNQVRFTLDSGITLMYDYYYGEWGTFINIPALSSTLYQSLHTYMNSFGQVFQETPGSYLDGSNPVLISFTTSWLNLAGLQGYERAYFFYLLGKYITPHKLAVQISYDYNPSPTQQSIITPDNYAPPWGSETLWGGSSYWGGQSNVEQWRVFLQQQKCEAFQVTINELFDPEFNTLAGAGLTLSGLALVVGLKSSYPRLKPTKSVG